MSCYTHESRQICPKLLPFKKKSVKHLNGLFKLHSENTGNVPSIMQKKKKRTSGVVALSVVGWTTVWSEHTIYSGLFPFLLVIPPLTDRKT